MPSGVVPDYQQCLLVWFLIIDHASWSIVTATDILLVELQLWCYLYSGAIIADMSADPVPLLEMSVCTRQLYQTCMLGLFSQIRVFLK